MVISNHSYAGLQWKSTNGTERDINCSLKRKRASGNLMLQLRLMLKEMDRLKRGLIFNVIKGKVTLRQDLTQLSFQLVKGKGLKNPLLLERNNKQKCTWFNGTRFHFKRAGKLVIVIHMVIALQSWKSRDHGIVLHEILRAAKASYMTRESLHGGPERPMCEAENWSLSCTEDRKTLAMPDHGIFAKESYGPGWMVDCRHQSWKGRTI